MKENNERRRFSRVDFNVPVVITQGVHQWQAELLDISLKGLLVQGSLPVEYDTHQPLRVNIQLSDQILINMSTALAHQEEHQTGLSCVSIDLESIAHLRRLIELNLGDPGAAERELAEFIAP